MKQYTEEINGTLEHYRQLDSLAELTHIAKDIAGREQSFRSQCASIQGTYNFTGTNSLEEAIDLCELGWPEGRERVSELMQRYSLDDELTNHGQTVEFSYGEAGDEPDIDRYLSGDTDNMVVYQVDPSLNGKRLHVVVNASQHAFVERGQIARRGAAIAIALDSLAASGYGVQLDIAERSAASGYREQKIVEYRIPIVEAGGFMDVDSLSFTLVHPSLLRRLIFSLNEHESPELRHTMGYNNGGGYGQPLELPAQPEDRTFVIGKSTCLLFEKAWRR